MYKRYGAAIVLVQFLMLAACFSVKGLEINRLAATPAFQVRFSEDFYQNERETQEGTSFVHLIKMAASGQRVIDFEVVTKDPRLQLAEEDYEALLRIVEAEATGEDEKGKILVANVVLNRVASEKFPDTVKKVVFQREDGVSQFSPISDGRYQSVCVTETTIEAVNKALDGVDYSQGALYFAAREYANPGRMVWFDQHLTLLFAYGGHEFFR